MKLWKKYKDEEPEIGLEVLAFHTSWIDEDINPKGIRIGYLLAESGGIFLSAKWNEYQDCYETDNQDPEYWIEIPELKIN